MTPTEKKNTEIAAKSFLQACEKGDLDKVAKLISSGLPTKIIVQSLLTAIQQEQFDLAKILSLPPKSMGVSLIHLLDSHKTDLAFTEAITENHIEQVRFFIDYLNFQPAFHHLEAAARIPSVEMVLLLREHGMGKLRKLEDLNSISLYKMAVESNHHTLMKALVAGGVPPPPSLAPRTASSKTRILHEELLKQQTLNNQFLRLSRSTTSKLEEMKNLVEQGADPLADDHAALLYSANRGHLENIQWLLDRGARIAVLDVKNRTPLQIAIHLKNDSIVKRLIHAEACAKIDPHRAFLSMIEVGELDYLDALVQAQPGFFTKNTLTNGLLYAAETPHVPVAQWLLEHGAVLSDGVMGKAGAKADTAMIRMMSEKGGNLRAALRTAPPRIKRLLQALQESQELHESTSVFSFPTLKTRL